MYVYSGTKVRLTNTDGGHYSEFDVACDMVAGGTHQTSTTTIHLSICSSMFPRLVFWH